MTYIPPKVSGEPAVASELKEAGAGGHATVRSPLPAGGYPRAVDPRPRTVSSGMRWVRGGLSAFIVFHLFSVLLVPNSDSYMGTYFGRVIQPYLFFFEMTNHWNFFSPNPEPPVFVDYQLLDGDGNAYQNGRWPETGESFFWQERKTRRVTAADFMVNSEIGAEKMMVNYLCHRSPRPGSVRIWRVMEAVPPAREVASGKRTLGDAVISERKFVSHTFCDAPEGTP